MCLLAIHYQTLPDAPILLAANREEFYDRPSLPPHIQPDEPRVLCGTDERAGGTWLGVNEHGLVAAVTNRRKADPQRQPRSRGLLCRELLQFQRASQAIEHAQQQLAGGDYAGANFVCLDPDFGAVLHAGDALEIVELDPGLHLVTDDDVNDAGDPRQTLARRLFNESSWGKPEEYVSAAQSVCARGPDADGVSIVLRASDRGTVSSMILALTTSPSRSLCCFSAGPPDMQSYDDLSEQVRAVLVGAEE